MDESEFTIKPDEYEPDLFNDMSVQEEITVGSTEHVISSNIVEHDFSGHHNQTPSSSTMNIINSSLIPQQDMKSKPKLIYLKPGNNMGKQLRLPPNVRVIPLSKLNTDSNNKILQLGQPMRSLSSLGGNIARVVNQQSLRNGQIQVTKLNNINLTKLPTGGQKIIINKSGGGYRNFTPIVSLQNSVGGNTFTSHQNTIIQPLNHHHHSSQSNPTTLKLEPGDSGFYNLTGGNGPTRYYPRMHSPDKDSLDGSQEMANVYKTNGLRKYARSVCDKVKEKGTTTYSEVADELVHEYAAEHPMIPATQLHYIQKNIRRRVYDALNVLMALKVLEKEKKEIKWKGLPVNLLEECRQLEEEKSRKTDILQQRVEELSELVLQLISYKNLVGRNRQREKENNIVPSNERIKLPFLVITTNNNTVIDCNISPEKLEYMFTFDQPFEMQDEFQTLKQSGFTLRLGTSQCTESQYKRCLELVPNTLRFYVEAIYQQRPAIVPDFLSLHRRNHMNNSNNNRAGPSSSSNNINKSNITFKSSSSVVGGVGSASLVGNQQQYSWIQQQQSGSVGGGGTSIGVINNAAGTSDIMRHHQTNKRYNTHQHQHHHQISGQQQQSASISNIVNATASSSSVVQQSYQHHRQHSTGGGVLVTGPPGVAASHHAHHFGVDDEEEDEEEEEEDIEVMDEDADFHSDD